MASSLWNLVDILTEGIHKIKCKNCGCFPECKCVEVIWILISGGFGSWKTNALLNLINHEPDIDKIYLYPKDP